MTNYYGKNNNLNLKSLFGKDPGFYYEVIISTCSDDHDPCDYIVYKYRNLLVDNRPTEVVMDLSKWENIDNVIYDFDEAKLSPYELGQKYFDIIVDEINNGKSKFLNKNITSVSFNYCVCGNWEYYYDEYDEVAKRYNKWKKGNKNSANNSINLYDFRPDFTYEYDDGTGGEHSEYIDVITEMKTYIPGENIFVENYCFDEELLYLENEFDPKFETRNPKGGILDNYVDLLFKQNPVLRYAVIVETVHNKHEVYGYEKTFIKNEIIEEKSAPSLWDEETLKLYSFNEYNLSPYELAQKYYDILIDEIKNGKTKFLNEKVVNISLHSSVIERKDVLKEEYEKLLNSFESKIDNNEEYESDGFPRIKDIHGIRAIVETKKYNVKDAIETFKYSFDSSDARVDFEFVFNRTYINPKDGLLDRNLEDYVSFDVDAENPFFITDKKKVVNKTTSNSNQNYTTIFSHLTKKGDGYQPVFSETELKKFWGLNKSLIDVVLTESGLDINECYYPLEDKLVNLFYLVIIRYMIKNDNYDSNKVTDYILYLEKLSWNSNKYLPKIINIIDMLLTIRDEKKDLEDTKSWISERL